MPPPLAGDEDRRNTESDERERQLRLHEIAVDEYRFQVNLNGERAKYLLGFDVAVIGVGAGLLRVGGPAGAFLATVFLVGFLAALLSIGAVHLQHGYYRSLAMRCGRRQTLWVLLITPSLPRSEALPSLSGVTKIAFRGGVSLYGVKL